MSKRRPGILIISPGGITGHGGMATVTNVIVEWLHHVQPDARITVLDPRGRGHVLLWPAFFIVTAVRMLVLRAAGQVDLLHLQVSERGSFIRKGILGLLGRALGARVVMHHHGAELIPFFRSASPAMRSWTRFVIRRADLNIVLGKRWRSFLAEEVGADEARVAVLPNAVPDSPAASRNALARAARDDSQPEPFIFLFLAELSPRKGVPQFLAALRSMHLAGYRVRAVLAGKGESQRYLDLARQIGVAEISSFVGWVGRSEVQRLFETVDALVIPSFEEGLPMAMLEALSNGLPVVATPVGSIPEFFTDGVECLLVPPGNEEKLASAMRRLLEDAELRRSLSQRGRARYQAAFTTDVFMRRLLDTYARAARMSG